MVQGISRGEIWMYTFAPPDKRRPVLILTRSIIIQSLTQVMVATITSTFHGAPSEVPIGIDQGLKHPSVVNLHQVYSVYKNLLRRYVGSLTPEQMQQVCQALAHAAGCS